MPSWRDNKRPAQGEPEKVNEQRRSQPRLKGAGDVAPRRRGIFAYYYFLSFLFFFPNTHTLFADVQQQKGQQERSSRASPLPQHDNFGPGAAPLAEGEELVDDPPRFAHELLPAELQLLVALQNRRLRLPEVLDGGRVEGVGCGQPPDKVLELICKSRETRTVMIFFFLFPFLHLV